MNKMKKVLGALGIAAMVVVPLTTAQATGFTLDGASSYIILYEGGGGNHLAINNFGNAGFWTGNIGIAGTGTLQATGPGTLNGDINFAAPNTGQATINNTTVNGTVNFGVAGVQTAMNNMNTLSSTLGAEAASGTALAVNTTSDQTVLASAGFLDAGGNRLFNVTSFSSQNGQNLIIKGDGSQNVVFDFNSDTQFHGNILLQDLTGKSFGDAGYAGLTPDQVLFNLYGGAGLTGGDTLDANNNGNPAHPANDMYGVFLDPNGTVSFVNTRITGRIFGGDTHDMQIVSGVTLTAPTTTVPDTGSTLALMSISLGLLVSAKRKFLS